MRCSRLSIRAPMGWSTKFATRTTTARVVDSVSVDAIKRFKDLTTNKAVERIINREIAMLKSLRSQHVVEMKEVFKK